MQRELTRQRTEPGPVPNGFPADCVPHLLSFLGPSAIAADAGMGLTPMDDAPKPNMLAQELRAAAPNDDILLDILETPAGVHVLWFVPRGRGYAAVLRLREAARDPWRMVGEHALPSLRARDLPPRDDHLAHGWLRAAPDGSVHMALTAGHDNVFSKMAVFCGSVSHGAMIPSPIMDRDPHRVRCVQGDEEPYLFVTFGYNDPQEVWKLTCDGWVYWRTLPSGIKCEDARMLATETALILAHDMARDYQLVLLTPSARLPLIVGHSKGNFKGEDDKIPEIVDTWCDNATGDTTVTVHAADGTRAVNFNYLRCPWPTMLRMPM